ncbi:MAG: hypothetical protein U0L10_05675, partial [Lachnospiraceae bacterium]|nr:hypothetical protein [Lachnospiraceae bacterium]
FHSPCGYSLRLFETAMADHVRSRQSFSRCGSGCVRILTWQQRNWQCGIRTEYSGRETGE